MMHDHSVTLASTIRKGTKKAPPASLTEQASQAIRNQIINGQLALGEAVSETSLAANLGMSKTPVREALLQLRREGLVQIYPKRGTYIFEVTEELVNDLSDFRNIIEISALELAMKRAWGRLMDFCEPIIQEMPEALGEEDAERYRRLDAAFHRGIIEHAGNPFLSDAFNSIAFRVQALRTRLSGVASNNERTCREHEEMLAAIRNRDVAKTCELMRAHIEATRVAYLAALAEV